MALLFIISVVGCCTWCPGHSVSLGAFLLLKVVLKFYPKVIQLDQSYQISRIVWLFAVPLGVMFGTVPLSVMFGTVVEVFFVC